MHDDILNKIGHNKGEKEVKRLNPQSACYMHEMKLTHIIIVLNKQHFSVRNVK